MKLHKYVMLSGLFIFFFIAVTGEAKSETITVLLDKLDQNYSTGDMQSLQSNLTKFERSVGIKDDHFMQKVAFDTYRHPQVRALVIKRISLTQLQDNIELFHNALTNENSPRVVRYAIIKRFSNMSDEEAFHSLIDVYDNPKSERNVRAFIVANFMKNNEKRALESLINSLEDKDLAVRYKAAQALGTIGEDRAIQALRDVVNNDLSPYVRKRAEISLIQLGAH